MLYMFKSFVSLLSGHASYHGEFAFPHILSTAVQSMHS